MDREGNPPECIGIGTGTGTGMGIIVGAILLLAEDIPGRG